MTKEESSSGNNATKDNTWKMPQYGFRPFLRAVPFFLILTSLSLMTIVFSKHTQFFRKPETLSGEHFLTWSFTSLIIPHIIVFFTIYVAGLSVLSLKSLRYVRWLIKSTLPGAILGFIIVEMVSFLIIFGFVSTASDFELAYNPNFDGNYIQNLLWGLSVYSIVCVGWVAYRISWSAYRQVGAQTMQERARRYEEKIKIKSSGQWWEKSVEYKFKKISGLDGNKPRGGFLYFLIFFPLIIFSTFLFGAYFFSDNSYLPLAVAITGLVLLVYMSLAKYLDTKGGRRQPYLIAVRDENTVDKYYPEDSVIIKD